MHKKMLRSVLVAAFSAVVAFGALTSLSGVKSDAHNTGGVQSVAVETVDDVPPAIPLDTRWD